VESPERNASAAAGSSGGTPRKASSRAPRLSRTSGSREVGSTCPSRANSATGASKAPNANAYAERCAPRRRSEETAV
jgi:hypothetical protein